MEARQVVDRRHLVVVEHVRTALPGTRCSERTVPAMGSLAKLSTVSWSCSGSASWWTITSMPWCETSGMSIWRLVAMP